MTIWRTAFLIFLGVILGLAAVAGTYRGLGYIAPKVLAQLLGGSTSPDTGIKQQGSLPVDMSLIKGMVQEIICSEQGKAILSDLLKSQPRETFQAMFSEAMKSPEFRKSLSDALETFFTSQEGRELMTKIAREVLKP